MSVYRPERAIGSARTRIALAIVAVAYLAAATIVYLGAVAPEWTLRIIPDRLGYLGPPADALLSAADAHVADGISSLRDGTLTGAQRVAEYRAALGRAERLVLRALRTQPRDGDALARLAAIRWELTLPTTEQGMRPILDLIDQAAALAPTSPPVYLKLGELLLQMGREADAMAKFKRAVTLDPGRASTAVQVLHNHFVPAKTIAAGLPPTSSGLSALRGVYLDEGLAVEYLDLVESAFETRRTDVSTGVLRAYGYVARVSGSSNRCIDALSQLGSLTDPAADSLRLAEMARCQLALGRLADAIALARQARMLNPSIEMAELVGDLQLENGAPTESAAALRDALRLAARNASPAADRARLYGKLGRAEEALGHIEKALDAYRLALDVDPNESNARHRLDVIAPGLRPSR